MKTQLDTTMDNQSKNLSITTNLIQGGHEYGQVTTHVYLNGVNGFMATCHKTGESQWCMHAGDAHYFAMMGFKA